MSIAYPTETQRALLLAISIERQNARYFKTWSQRFMTHDGDISRFLNELADEEVGHERELSQMYKAMFKNDVPNDISPPTNLNKYLTDLDKIKSHYFIVDSVSAETLLNMAFQIEKYTEQFYLDLMLNTTHAELSELYRCLAEFEDDHKKMFQQKIDQTRTKLPFSA